MLHDDFYSLFNVSDTIIDSRTAGESKLSQESFQEAEIVSGRISCIYSYSFHPYKNARPVSYNQNILSNVLCWVQLDLFR